MSRPDHCELCQRKVAYLTRHHLIPRTRHANKRNKKLFDRKEVHTRIVWFCRPCHDQVHAVLTEKTLEHEYNTLEEIAAHPEIKKFAEWIKNKPPETRVSVKTAKSRR